MTTETRTVRRHPSFVDMTGLRFGKLLVVKEAPTGKCGVAWDCICDCGKIKKAVPAKDLKIGSPRSCGCTLRKHKFAKANRLELKIWHSMLRRCGASESRDYKYYGARGIKVCKKWQNSFDAFLIDMGPRPSKRHSIDRIKNDGDYKPSNCRWATAKEQGQNKRPVKIWTINGAKFNSCRAASKALGISACTIAIRCKSGLPGWRVNRRDEHV